jgi:polyisoprenyl-phosphate glycosyltransferase
MEISVISPVYKAEKIIDELVRRLTVELTKITSDYEIILVEDGSLDDSWKKITENATRDRKIRGIKLSRNFGQHHAITAGLDNCSGQWIIIMDCDLQDRPEEIKNLYHKTTEGYDLVFARRIARTDKFFKKMTSQLFYLVFSYLSGIKQDGSIANFGIYSKKAIDAINRMREPMRGFSPMARWIGFKKTAIEVVHGERFEGPTSYNWNKLINFALEIALAYSDKPLKLVVKTGLIISVLSILFAAYNVVAYFNGSIKVIGYASIITSIWFLSGLIILILGVIGLYIGKIFDGIKDRPLYLIDQITF